MAKVVTIQPEQIRQIHERYMAGESLADCVAGHGLSVSTAISRFNKMGLKYPRPKATVTGLPPRFTLDKPISNIAAAVPPAPDGQMDEPETAVAAATEPAPVVEGAQALARQRARDLHERVVADTQVIAVQELPSPMLARKQYSVPRILESGSMLDFMNPRVQAYFEWRAEGRTGQPLGR